MAQECNEATQSCDHPTGEIPVEVYEDAGATEAIPESQTVEPAGPPPEPAAELPHTGAGEQVALLVALAMVAVGVALLRLTRP